MKNLIKGLFVKKGIDTISNFINDSIDNMFFSINITSMMWGFTTLEEIFPSVGYTVYYSNIDGDVRQIKQNPSCGSVMIRKRSVLRLYHGLPIWLDMIPDANADNKNAASTGNYFLRTFNQKKFLDNMNHFIERMFVYNNKHQKALWNKTNRANTPGRGGFRDIVIRKRRSFDEIFIPKADKELLIKSLDDFVAKRQWYIDNNIPYHFGILLYGEPGTGKSIITQAIADHLNARYNVLNGADVGWLEDSLNELCTRPDDSCYSVLAIEDVDCAFKNSNIIDNLTADDKRRKAELSSILNCMDGVWASDNIIYVLTTNHKDALDPALIRPGRCDIQLEIKGVCEETFRDFCMFHYKQYPNRTVNIRRHITFAELQTDVMRGYTIDQLIEKLEDENENT